MKWQAAITFAVDSVLAASEEQKRNFLESVELQVSLNSMPPVEKRYNGTLFLPNEVRCNINVCLFSRGKHRIEAMELGIDTVSIQELKYYAKHEDKKIMKKLRTCSLYVIMMLILSSENV